MIEGKRGRAGGNGTAGSEPLELAPVEQRFDAERIPVGRHLLVGRHGCRVRSRLEDLAQQVIVARQRKKQAGATEHVVHGGAIASGSPIGSYQLRRSEGPSCGQRLRARRT